MLRREDRRAVLVARALRADNALHGLVYAELPQVLGARHLHEERGAPSFPLLLRQRLAEPLPRGDAAEGLLVDDDGGLGRLRRVRGRRLPAPEELAVALVRLLLLLGDQAGEPLDLCSPELVGVGVRLLSRHADRRERRNGRDCGVQRWP